MKSSSSKTILPMLIPKPLVFYPNINKKLTNQGKGVWRNNSEKTLSNSCVRNRISKTNLALNTELSPWRRDVLAIKNTPFTQQSTKHSKFQDKLKNELMVYGNQCQANRSCNLTQAYWKSNISQEEIMIKARSSPELSQWAEAFTKPTVRRLNHVLACLTDPTTSKYRRRTKCSCLYHVL